MIAVVTTVIADAVVVRNTALPVRLVEGDIPHVIVPFELGLLVGYLLLFSHYFPPSYSQAFNAPLHKKTLRT